MLFLMKTVLAKVLDSSDTTFMSKDANCKGMLQVKPNPCVC